MVFEFLQPVNAACLHFIKNLSPQSLGRKVVLHTATDFPNLENVQIAIIGINEYRGSNAANIENELSFFRKNFYSLFPGNWNLQIADLGNIQPGDSIEDTYFLVKTLCANLIKKKIIPVIVGGSQDVSYPIYRAYDNLEQMVNLVSIDNKFDFAKENTNLCNSFLSKIIIEEPNNLFNYSNIGFQTYYNAQEEVDLMDKLYFDAYRLGEVSKNIAIAEPVFRDADFVSLDMHSVSSSFSGNYKQFYPNGFTGKEICALARYAGISDRVSSFGVFNFTDTATEAVLIAQIVWYFVEGYSFRSYEYPFASKEDLIKYIVLIEDSELVFYKSDKTDRWWVEIPFASMVHNKLKKNTLLPCTKEDYLRACEEEIPERWWKAQRRNML